MSVGSTTPLMTSRKLSGALLGQILLATILFTVFRMLPSFVALMDRLADRGWSLLPIILVTVLLQMLLSGAVVLLIMPPVLGAGRRWHWLADMLRVDGRGVLLGLLSFVAFGALAATLASAMGIFSGDASLVFAWPDLTPDPDVVGWGFFILALVPGVWEELAFRGLIQSRARHALESERIAILVSSSFFGLFHLSLLVANTPDVVVGQVLMAFVFGLGWGYMTVRARSVIPAMLSHYLVDALGQVFVTVDSEDPGVTAAYMLLLTLLFPALVILLTKLLYRHTAQQPRPTHVPAPRG